MWRWLDIAEEEREREKQGEKVSGEENGEPRRLSRSRVAERHGYAGERRGRPRVSGHSGRVDGQGVTRRPVQWEVGVRV